MRHRRVVCVYGRKGGSNWCDTVIPITFRHRTFRSRFRHTISGKLNPRWRAHHYDLEHKNTSKHFSFLFFSFFFTYVLESKARKRKRFRRFDIYLPPLLFIRPWSCVILTRLLQCFSTCGSLLVNFDFLNRTS